MPSKILEVSTLVQLETEECCVCGVIFAMPASLRQKLSRDGGSFYCPTGHSQHYTEPTVEVLKRELRSAQDRANTLEYQLNGALDDLTTKKKEIRSIKRRVHAGVCIHCHRHFENLESHMKTKHLKQSGGEG